MNNILRLTYYLLAWQRTGKWLFLTGTAALALTPVLAWILDSKFAFGVWIYGYISAFGLPFLAAPVAFRQLLSLRRMGLVPTFHFNTGLSLLLLVCALALLMPLGAALYWPQALSDFFGIQMFVVASLYAALVQWALTSAVLVLMMSFVLPVFFIIILNLFHATLFPWFHNPVLNLLLFAACIGAWCMALNRLSTHMNFTPICTSPLGYNKYMGSGRGWLGTLLSAPYPTAIRSAAGSLLQGFPDNRMSRALFTLNLIGVSPLFCTVVLTLLSSSSDKSDRLDPIALFMLFSMITSIITSFGGGELAARSRLLWLRCGGNRQSLWTTLENLLASNLLLLNMLAAGIAVLCMLLSKQSVISPLDYYLVIASCTLLGSYFSLAARICQWALLPQLIVITLLGPGVAVALLQTVVLVHIYQLASVIVLLALGFRWQAKRAFTRIDWTQVKPRQFAQMKR